MCKNVLGRDKMKFALINSEKCEATKGAKGLCRCFGSELIAKCGENRVHYWAHKVDLNCDPWWENETDWHHSWKNNFPEKWQEVIYMDEVSGEKLIADIKTDSHWVLEIQHSPIKPEERRSRNAFYSKLVWVIDGKKSKRDKPKFCKILEEHGFRKDNPHLMRIFSPDDSALIKEWHESDRL